MEDPLAPFIRALNEQIDARNAAQVGALDQLKSATTEQARAILAHYVLTCMYYEKGNKNQTSEHALKFAFKIKQLAPVEVLGVISSLTEMITEFLLDQSDGTFVDVVKRLLDPDIPLIPGRNDVIRELDKQFNTKGPSSD